MAWLSLASSEECSTWNVTKTASKEHRMDRTQVGRILDRKPSANGKPHTTNSLRRRRRQPMAASMPRLAVAVTVMIGVAIPALTLTLSTLAGRLAESRYGMLAACAAAVGLAVLAVSLAHLAWAIGDITRSPRWASWLLAVACDASIVLAECVLVFAPEAGCRQLAVGLLFAVTLCSMLLNVWAFLRGR
jgi:hypothetical protein